MKVEYRLKVDFCLITHQTPRFGVSFHSVYLPLRQYYVNLIHYAHLLTRSPIRQQRVAFVRTSSLSCSSNEL
jgi:hypothetical protein